MTDAADSNRADREAMQPAETAEARDKQQGASEAPAPEGSAKDRRDATHNRAAEKPELESPARENLERVGVDAEHKTEAMRKHQRGTFP